MLPFEEAREVRKSILSYIASQYPVSDPAVRKKFGAFLEHPEEGLFNKRYDPAGYHSHYRSYGGQLI